MPSHPLRALRLLPILAPGLLLAAVGLAEIARGTSDPPGEVPMSISASGYDVTPLPPDEVARLAAKLDPESWAVTQRQGTERPFCGRLLHEHEEGIYACKVCALPLFHSADKFDSGTGWPSFRGPLDPAHVAERADASHGMQRTELRCARCGAHLGHVFDDGPAPEGRRYCLNSAALDFTPASAELPGARVETAWFAGGCFWGIEHAFAQIPGVLDAASGYAGGTVQEPSYAQVCTGRTGHAETVQVRFDPAVVAYEDLVRAFFAMHDPSSLDRQGPDVGTQYRSAIFTADEAQAAMARRVAEEVARSPRLAGRPVVTAIEPFSSFFLAEDYHQDYHARRGGSCPLPPR